MSKSVVTKVTNAILYDDGSIKIENVRCSYPHLAKAYSGTNENGEAGEPKFSIVTLLPKNTHSAAKDLIKKVIKEEIAKSKLPIGEDGWFLRDGDRGAKDENVGMFVISSRESRRPSVRDKRGDVVDQDKIDALFYGGCWVNVLIRPWVQNNKYGKKVNASLIAVQFHHDDTAFGEGRIDDDGVFEAVDDAVDDNGTDDTDL